MTLLNKGIRLAIAFSLLTTGSVIFAKSSNATTCDDKCPFDGTGEFILCTEQNPAVLCQYNDTHYYTSFGGSCGPE